MKSPLKEEEKQQRQLCSQLGKLLSLKQTSTKNRTRMMALSWLIHLRQREITQLIPQFQNFQKRSFI